MIIFDTGRGCARAILGELVADHPPRLTPNSAGKRRYGEGNLDLGRKEAGEERRERGSREVGRRKEGEINAKERRGG